MTKFGLAIAATANKITRLGLVPSIRHSIRSLALARAAPMRGAADAVLTMGCVAVLTTASLPCELDLPTLRGLLDLLT